MGVYYGSAIFLSARGVNKTVNTKLLSMDDLVTIENIPSRMASFRRAMLRYDSLEVRASIKGKIEIIIITEMESITNFILNGELEFLKEMNEMAFLDLCNKKNILDENILIYSPSKLKSFGENIGMLSETIRDYEKIMQEFVDWFVSNNMVVPSITQQKYSLKSAQKIIMSGNQNDLDVSISCFDTLVLIIPKHIEPGNKIGFRLEGESHQTKLIKLDHVPYSYLMYLAMERKENGNMWMLNPEYHIDELHQIYEQLEIPISYDPEIKNELPSRMNWFNDHSNNYRKTINSEINKIVRQEGSITGNLLNNLGNVSPSRNGIYTLAKSIQNIK